MFRLLLISSFCAIFIACSSDDPVALNEWFKDQGIATSYGKEYMEIPITLKNVSKGKNESAYMVSTFAALGKTNGIEQSLYFGLEVSDTDTLSSIWKLITDSLFYKDVYGGEFPSGQKNIEAKIYWLYEGHEFETDSLWLEFKNTSFEGSDDITLKWGAGENRDTFYVELPQALLNATRPENGKVSYILVQIKPITENAVLRFAPPDTPYVRCLQRVAQKTYIDDECERCLHSGVRESINVAIEIIDSLKQIIASETVVFSQLVLSNQQTSTEKSELGYPLPIYIYNNKDLENYKQDSTFIFQDNTLILQTTHSMRRYGWPDRDNVFTLWLGNPILDIEDYQQLSRPAYASYDFGSAIEDEAEATMRIWFADYDGKE